MEIKKILVSMPTRPWHREKMRQALPEADITFSDSTRMADDELAPFDAVVGYVNPNRLHVLNNLKVLQLHFSGVEEGFLELKEKQPQAVLFSASGAYGQAISEYLLAALLSLYKLLPRYRDNQGKKVWEDLGRMRSLRGQTVLVVGAGSIGNDFAALVKALGAGEVIGIRRTQALAHPPFDAMHTLEDLDDLLPRADVVSLSLPETQETVGLMDARRFSLMKEEAIIMNVGRGSAIDEAALLEAIRSGRLSGAALDVTDTEPLPRDSPLWEEPRVLLTPHVSGKYNLDATWENVVDIAIHNLLAWPLGPFISRVDYGTGYRERMD
ncbi:MAG: D-2-hydroxyacid dehydrogenase [Eubacteriales bacterium]|nr:D-2-hydroxyacid dehydrogenase [Eubacteriales bacterium]